MVAAESHMRSFFWSARVSHTTDRFTEAALWYSLLALVHWQLEAAFAFREACRPRVHSRWRRMLAGIVNRPDRCVLEGYSLSDEANGIGVWLTFEQNAAVSRLTGRPPLDPPLLPAKSPTPFLKG